jgi:DNA-binding NarL/FixJ family response regulator
MLRPLAIRVVLAEDNYLVREGVRRLLEQEVDVEVIDVCEDLDSLRQAIATVTPDVVVTDIRMPPTSTDEGIRIAGELRDTHPEIGVVVLSQFLEPQYALALLERGAAGRAYVLKERVRDLDQLVGAIREVAAGGSVIDVKVVEALVAARSRSDASPLAELTPRELQALEEMAQGKSNAAIAEALVITEHSVEKVTHSIFLKLGLTWQPDINRRVKAVLVYLSEERLPPDRAGP